MGWRRWGGTAVVVAAGLGAVPSAPAAAQEQPVVVSGCALANAQEPNLLLEHGAALLGVDFYAGETLTFQVTDPTPATPTGMRIEFPLYTPVASAPLNGAGLLSYTFPVDALDTSVYFFVDAGPVNATLSCTPAAGSAGSTYSVADLTITEGDGGVNTPKIAKFTVARTGDLSTAGSVAVHTESGTSGARAIQDKDFKKRDTILHFPAGVSSVVLEVKIIGDLIDEPNERFRVVLDKPVGGTVSDHLGLGTIVDDD